MLINQNLPRTNQLTVAQSLEGLQALFQKVTDLGKPPSQKWCQAAFANFDVDERGTIHVESWCEIVRKKTKKLTLKIYVDGQKLTQTESKFESYS
jgi:hypothetical protein